ncbi:bifunctional metallophosphatase/5'-nucleotidase [Lacrimispora amygdalina]|uniref:Bifunctional metallophosphatase/5'-nucleotidase n=1 Tax=Lacrimispora amygdalina TaxID=253257 RepID=A0A3E2ND47_9FIRM|nr:bifunctional UDP-sugar hydrolase/5'-nucleotidase [Clostridium indicum]RFZ78922.1 bifunctional metallophosphatase/5'-nucleotidase [Clostridium indicum]
MRLTILHTNDIHSNFDNFSKIVNQMTGWKDSNTLVLDAGDFADFKRIELLGTDGLAAMELLDSTGYDALAVGNNEIFQGLDVLKYMAANAKIPLLSSNLRCADHSEIKEVKRSIIINKNGLRILIIGASPDIGPFNELLGFTLIDYLAAVQHEIDEYHEQYDMCILLSHLGMDKDKEIAVKISGVDIIIGGHFHILMDQPEIVNGTIIHTSGAQGEYIGKLVVEVKNNQVQLIEGINIDVLNSEGSTIVQEIVKQNKIKAIDRLSEPFCRINKNLWHDVVEENPMTNLLADALQDFLGCDLAIINSGVINGGIKKGDVSRKKIIELCPSPLNPTSFQIQGKDLWEALQNSLDTDYCYADGKGAGFRGKYVGRLHVSGAVIEHNGRNILNIYIHGVSINMEKWYTVASSDYLQRGTGYQTLARNHDEQYSKEYLRDIIQEYVMQEAFVEKAFVERWILK